ncbi:hypothetical protein LC55x_3238 [Lysobacter capsici]|nr:hypothetical protein LC55x_3238 [Lysobacter capsici]
MPNERWAVRSTVVGPSFDERGRLLRDSGAQMPVDYDRGNNWRPSCVRCTWAAKRRASIRRMRRRSTSGYRSRRNYVATPFASALA